MAETDTATVSVLHAGIMRSADMTNHLKNPVHEKRCFHHAIVIQCIGITIHSLILQIAEG